MLRPGKTLFESKLIAGLFLGITAGSISISRLLNRNQPIATCMPRIRHFTHEAHLQVDT
jgi:hypothetical protein